MVGRLEGWGVVGERLREGCLERVLWVRRETCLAASELWANLGRLGSVDFLGFLTYLIFTYLTYL